MKLKKTLEELGCEFIELSTNELFFYHKKIKFMIYRRSRNHFLQLCDVEEVSRVELFINYQNLIIFSNESLQSYLDDLTKQVEKNPGLYQRYCAHYNKISIKKHNPEFDKFGFF